MSQSTHSILKSKRVLDILCSLFILVVTLPFSIVILFLIKLTQIVRGNFRGPLFYSEIRMSHGKEFKLYKFYIFKYEQILEAMRNGDFIHTKYFEKNGGVTKIGWVLKQIYMDELPQFYNVLRGDLSIVGPRPVNLEVSESLEKQGFTAKKMVRAGITGNFQSFKDTDGKRANTMDQEYVEYYKNNPWYKVLLFDIKIMLRTVKVILRAKGI